MSKHLEQCYWSKWRWLVAVCGLQELCNDKCIIVMDCHEGVDVFLQHWNLLRIVG